MHEWEGQKSYEPLLFAGSPRLSRFSDLGAGGDVGHAIMYSRPSGGDRRSGGGQRENDKEGDADLRRQLAEVLGQLDKCKVQVVRLTTECDDLKATIKRQTRSLCVLAETQEASGKTERKNAELEETIATLRKQLQTAQGSSIVDSEQLMGKLRVLEQHVETTLNGAAKLQKQRDEAVATQDKLLARVGELEGEKEAQRAQLASALSSFDQYDEYMKSRAGKEQEDQDRMRSLEALVAHLQNEGRRVAEWYGTQLDAYNIQLAAALDTCNSLVSDIEFLSARLSVGVDACAHAVLDAVERFENNAEALRECQWKLGVALAEQAAMADENQA